MANNQDNLIKDILEATCNGLDIICDYYPQASKCIGHPKIKFSIRNEMEPSAVLRPPLSLGNNTSYWKVKDFGDNGGMMSAFDICMKEERDVNDFYSALQFLAKKYSVHDENGRSRNHPEIVKRKATNDEKSGDIFKLLDVIPENHLRVLVPGLTQEHADKIHLYEAEYVGFVDEHGNATLRYSTEFYPIFLRECRSEDGNPSKTFYKQYEPKNHDKNKRFRYINSKRKPVDYVNGWVELLDMYNKLQDEDALDPDDDDDDEPRKPRKVDRVIICSGERDALTCLVYGGIPLWFNSETYKPSAKTMGEIARRVSFIYNIPDIDETGVRCGTSFALEYMNVRTVWLPESLRCYRDWRGLPCKDLSDYMLINPGVSSFESLLVGALPACFWKYNPEGRGRKEVEIESVRLYYFLELNGFHSMYDEMMDAVSYVHQDGQIIKEIRSREVREFVREWAANRDFSTSADLEVRVRINERIRSLLCTSFKLSDSSLENLGNRKYNFDAYNTEAQYVCFQNGVVMVTADIIKFYGKDKSLGVFFREKDIIPHDYVEDIDPVTKRERRFFDVSDDFQSITVLDNTSSPLFCYEISTARIHWKDEMLNNCGDDARKLAEYREAHKFLINSPLLTPEQNSAQERCLISHMYSRGYLMFDQKFLSMAKLVIALDEDVSPKGKSNGRSGKSFFFETIVMDKEADHISGRKHQTVDDKFLFDRIKPSTKVLIIDDFTPSGKISDWFDTVTNGMVVNKKNMNTFYISYEKCPKIAVSTNGVPFDFDGSTMDRLLPITFSSYYHQQAKENSHIDSYSIRDEFGFDLNSNMYPEEYYQADYRYKMQCLQLHLKMQKMGIKPSPPMEGIYQRKLAEEIDTSVPAFIEDYFTIEEHVNVDIPQNQLYADYMMFCKNRSYKIITQNKFTRDLKSYCFLTKEYEYNPEDVDHRHPDGRISYGTPIVYYIHMRNTRL